jgi:hypothetical protein
MSERNFSGIGTEARGKLRALRSQLNRYERQIDDVLDNNKLDTSLLVYFKPGNMRREHLAKKMTHILGPGVHFQYRNPNWLCWVYLCARERVVINDNTNDKGVSQNCICINYILTGKFSIYAHESSWAKGLWTIEFTDHSIGRLIQRSSKNDPDPISVMLSAHKSILHTPIYDIEDCLKKRSKIFLLPSGSGVFICQILLGIEKSDQSFAFHVRARTWIHNDQLRDNQYSIASDALDGESLGDSFLLPYPLRPLTFVNI